MKIGIDATLLRSDRISGIERYTQNIIEYLVNNDSQNEYVIFVKNYNLDHLKNKAKIVNCPINNRVVCDQLWMPWKIFNEKLDLIYFPGFPSPLMCFHSKIVLTIFDATLWKYPETRSTGGKYYYQPLFNIAAQRCKKIVTSSHSSKNDLKEYHGLNENKFEVIYISYDQKFTSEKYKDRVDMNQKYNLPEKYILAVGTLEPRKNLNFLLKGFTEFQNIRDDYKLVIVGRKGWQRSLVIDNKVEDKVIFTGFIDDDDLPSIYKYADLFVFPSLYEGFGIPLLESFASNVPVVASDIGAFREVGRDALHYIDPHNSESLVEGFRLCLSDEMLRNKLIERGGKLLKEYTWENTGKKLKNTFEEVYNEKNKNIKHRH